MKVRGAIFIVALFVTLPGCMMVRDGNVKSPSQWPLQTGSQAKKSLSLNVVRESRAPQQSISSTTIEQYRDVAIKAYTESGLFSTVTAGAGSISDVNADIAIIEDAGEETSFLPAFFSILTFTVIPGYVSEDMKVRTVYRDREQKALGTFEKQGRTKHWIQLFLLFAMPFIDGPDEVSASVLFDLHRTTIEEAHGKGLF